MSILQSHSIPNANPAQPIKRASSLLIKFLNSFIHICMQVCMRIYITAGATLNTHICICVVMEPFILKFLAVYVGAEEEEQIALKLLNYPLTKIISATE